MILYHHMFEVKHLLNHAKKQKNIDIRQNFLYSVPIKKHYIEGDKMDPVKLLGFFNLTRQESVLYLLLCTEGRLTGYEAAKKSGISRSNTYTALAGLVEKSAAYVEESTVTHYTPVLIDEFCENRIRHMQEYKDFLVKTVPCLKKAPEGYITIKGEENIQDKMKIMIDEARERIYLAVSQQTVRMLLPQIQKALDRGLKVVIITDPPFTLNNAQVYHTITPQHQIRLIADSVRVLTGDTTFGPESTCLYSQKQNLVDLFKEALKNEITLIELTKGR